MSINSARFFGGRSIPLTQPRYISRASSCPEITRTSKSARSRTRLNKQRPHYRLPGRQRSPARRSLPRRSRAPLPRTARRPVRPARLPPRSANARRCFRRHALSPYREAHLSVLPTWSNSPSPSRTTCFLGSQRGPSSVRLHFHDSQSHGVGSNIHRGKDTHRPLAYPMRRENCPYSPADSPQPPIMGEP